MNFWYIKVEGTPRLINHVPSLTVKVFGSQRKISSNNIISSDHFSYFFLPMTLLVDNDPSNTY